MSVTVAIPVRDGGPLLERTLAALATQTVAHELLVCDSGSLDGSVALARDYQARVVKIPPEDFGHGATRNLLMAEARGAHVALLTQDAIPAGERWLEALLGGFELAGDVGVVYGPYRPRADASPAVAMELQWWFSSLAPDGAPSVERLDERERALPGRELVRQNAWEWVGRRGFLSDANACIARAAWERVPFRAVPYAEDRVLALDMLRAGYAKAFVPAAAVVHSHDYPPLARLQRSFDEWRGLREVYGWREPLAPGRVAGELRGALARARRELLAQGTPAAQRRATLAALSAHHVLRLAGALLGSRADLLAPTLRRALSLEGRAGFAPLDLDAPCAPPRTHDVPSTSPRTPDAPCAPPRTHDAQ